jgi:hypothetical protein
MSPRATATGSAADGAEAVMRLVSPQADGAPTD